MARLILLRHGKSDWDASFSSDRQRPLAPRGRRAAASVGSTLTAQSLAPDLVLTSPAVRAATTAELAAEAGGWTCPVRVVEELYGSGVVTVLNVVSQTPLSVQTLMLVGHEPTWSGTVQTLTGAHVAVKTGTAVTIDLLGNWSRVADGGEVWSVLQPRSLDD
ncbi:MAG: histidine phosphatase family protein [Acidimicrobiia bacterium]|nr:histidine phosphatase family protein [Acidimicrobiia bacterium]